MYVYRRCYMFVSVQQFHRTLIFASYSSLDTKNPQDQGNFFKFPQINEKERGRERDHATVCSIHLDAQTPQIQEEDSPPLFIGE